MNLQDRPINTDIGLYGDELYSFELLTLIFDVYMLFVLQTKNIGFHTLEFEKTHQAKQKSKRSMTPEHIYS